MPLIRKKTSKRGTTRHREKIKHKISEHRKKTKKQARQDKAAGKLVQKKSKKDPGIPNNFPYKDQILAEVAEQRRQAAAEKQRKREEKKRATAAAADDDSDDLERSPIPEDVDVHAHTPKRVGRNVKQEGTPSIPVSPGPSTLRQVVEKADVVLHVVDARDPVAGISDALAEAAQGKLTVLLNKADTVPRESLAQWLVHLRASFPRPNQKAKPKPKDDALGLAGLDWSDKRRQVVCYQFDCGLGRILDIQYGYGNSAKGPYTTTSAEEVVVAVPGKEGRKVRFIDTPGLQFVRAASTTEEEREAERARDVLLRCRGRIERLKDPLFAVTHVVEHAETQDLMLAYGLPAFVQGDVRGFLAALARVSGLIKKRGVLDHAGAARIVLRDWSTGKLMRYSMPGEASGETTEEDAAVLNAVKSRRELRSEKMVKMRVGDRDGREVDMDMEWEEEEEDVTVAIKRKVSFAIVEKGKRRRE
ncbi:GNL3L/Grn1 putative GTPase-domain-containing protein [Chiua virens]|nr:GNL3L/Grn1 putative GTPase-domain-containing protein [Chiua virens]